MHNERKYLMICKLHDGVVEFQPAYMDDNFSSADHSALRDMYRFNREYTRQEGVRKQVSFDSVLIDDIAMVGRLRTPLNYVGTLGGQGLISFIESYANRQQVRRLEGFNEYLTQGPMAAALSGNRPVLYDYMMDSDQNCYVVALHRGVLTATQIVEDCVIYKGQIVTVSSQITVMEQQLELEMSRRKRHIEGLRAAEDAITLTDSELPMMAVAAAARINSQSR